MRFLFITGLLYGLVSVAVSQTQCDGEYACEEHGPDNGLIEKIHDVFTVNICRAHCQDMYEFGCRYFTHWSAPGEHHAECWLFKSCRHHRPDCHDHNCISGPAICDMSCNPLPQNTDGVWSCFPEVPDGESVPPNTHCVFECGNETSSHICTGGGWDNDPSDVECDIPQFCPPLADVDNSNGGVFHCDPHVEPDMEAAEGTYCVFECDGHETGETECDFHGNWFPDPGTFKCHDPTTTTPLPTTATTLPTTTTTTTTTLPTTTTTTTMPPPTENPTEKPTEEPPLKTTTTTMPPPTEKPTEEPPLKTTTTTMPPPTEKPPEKPTEEPPLKTTTTTTTTMPPPTEKPPEKPTEEPPLKTTTTILM